MDDSSMTKLRIAGTLDRDEFIAMDVMDEERYEGDASVMTSEVSRRRKLLPRVRLLRAALLYKTR